MRIAPKIARALTSVWEKTQFCSKQHARVIVQIYYVRLFVFNRRMCSIATPKNVRGKNCAWLMVSAVLSERFLRNSSVIIMTAG
jgi:hypothetical protein